ncbi:MAG: flagellar protein FlaG [Anaerolineaceae bacterium]|nr:flagellar protein FlaG [Anaerolineaceae bacterium]
MGDVPVQNVGGINSIDSTRAAAQLFQVYQAYQANVVGKATKTTRKEAPSNGAMESALMNENEINVLDPTKVDEEAKKQISKIAPNLGKETYLKFQVNSETNDVTVMIVDKNTDKVISTIPSEAIKKIPSGDLFQYSA